MDEILDQDLTVSKNTKLYSQRSILTATFLLGPIATGILMRRNFLYLNDYRKASNALWIGILSMLLIIVTLTLIPSTIADKIPSIILPLIYTGITQIIIEKQMGELLRIHKQSKGEFYPVWKIITLSLAIFVVVFLIAFIVSDLSSIAPY